MSDEDTEWIAATAFVPAQAWRLVRGDPDRVQALLENFTKSLGEEIEAHEGANSGWNVDRLAHHGPERDVPEYGRGVTVVLRAWRKTRPA